MQVDDKPPEEVANTNSFNALAKGETTDDEAMGEAVQKEEEEAALPNYDEDEEE